MTAGCWLVGWVKALDPSNFPVFQLWHRMQSFPSTITTTNFSTTTSTKAATTSGDSIRASVAHLLTRAFSLPCSTGAMAFAQLVQPNSRFQLALDALLPILDSNKPAEVAIGFYATQSERLTTSIS